MSLADLPIKWLEKRKEK